MNCRVSQYKIIQKTKREEKGSFLRRLALKLDFIEKQDVTSQKLQHCEVYKCTLISVLYDELKCGL